MRDPIPDNMQALQLSAYDIELEKALQNLQVKQLPVPKPLRRDDVLVKMQAAPCNPSDLLLLQGMYGVTKSLPTIPGWEGTGIVVAHGGGVRARWLMGKRVACARQGNQDGTWSDYFVADAFSCIPLADDIPTEQAASLIVNPFTAVGLFERAISGKHQAAVQTAAAGQVGRMLVSIAANNKFPLINIVRRREQLDLVKSMGGHIVLNSEEENFQEALEKVCSDLGATIAFDAVAGQMTGKLLDAMPNGGEVVVYGALSYEPCQAIDPIEVIFSDKRVSGFYLGNMFRRMGFLKKAQVIRHVKHLVSSEIIETTIARRVPLGEAADAMRDYSQRMSEGKILLMPSLAARGQQ